MFGIGFGELLIIIVVLIVAVGPDQLPSLMRTIGKAIRSMRQASQDLRDSIGLDEFVNRDLLNHRRPPHRRVKPDIALPPNHVEPMGNDAKSEQDESAPEIDTNKPSDSIESTGQTAESVETPVDQKEKEQPKEKAGEN